MATQISFSDINTRTGQLANYSSSMTWIKSITKTGQESNSLGDYNNKYWYTRDVDGNCNNTNCTTGPASSGNKNCVDCYTTALTNAQITALPGGGINCDTKNYLQTNCNCACTYNCNKQQYTTNCDCNCNCDCLLCACACF